MKLPKELTTVTRLSKTLALILVILLPVIGFFFGMRYQQMEDTLQILLNQQTLPVKRAPTPPPPKLVTTTLWKTYTNNLGIFSIQYPPDWTVILSHTVSNRVVDDSKELNTATLAGKEGQVIIEWGPMGFGGGGCPYTTFAIKNKTLTICNSIVAGRENWWFLSNGRQDDRVAEARATAYQPLARNAAVVQAILSSLSYY